MAGDERHQHPPQFAGRYLGCVLDDAGNCSRWNHDHPPAEAVTPPDSEEVGTGAGEGATGQDTATDYDSSTAMVTQEEAWMTATELFGALDGWLSRGGFLPSDWDRK